MPTTSYTDDSFGAFAIGARTDAAGNPVDDVSAEEARLINQILTAGIVEPADGWLVQERGAGANMSVDVGSGVAKSDLAMVEGQIAGQGRYLVRKELATVNVTVPAADVSQARTDEVYLVVADAPYDSGSLALPRIGYRQGDAGGGAPGPDSAWDAYLLLATISVPANDTSIEDAQITDERVRAGVSLTSEVQAAENAFDLTVLNLTGTFATTVTATLTVPSGWDSYRIEAIGTLRAAQRGPLANPSNGASVETRISVGGSNSHTALASVSQYAPYGYPTVLAVFESQSATGSVAVTLQARQVGISGDGALIGYAQLLARAVRTS